MENKGEKSKDKKIIKDSQDMPVNKLLQGFIMILVINLFFIVIFAYFISPLSRVDTISVEGNKDVYVQKIIDESSINPGDSLYDSKKKFSDVEKEIVNQFPQISSSKLTIDGMNKVLIQVDEFSTVAYIAEDESYLRVLENGHVLEDLYTTSIGNQLVLLKFKEGEALDMIIEELKKVDDSILNLISEVELTKTDQNPLSIQVYMNNGNHILSKIPDFSEKILYYPQMVKAVEGKKGVFDMEAGIYFMPFLDGESEESGINEEDGQEIDEFDR